VVGDPADGDGAPGVAAGGGAPPPAPVPAVVRPVSADGGEPDGPGSPAATLATGWWRTTTTTTVGVVVPGSDDGAGEDCADWLWPPPASNAMVPKVAEALRPAARVRAAAARCRRRPLPAAGAPVARRLAARREPSVDSVMSPIVGPGNTDRWVIVVRLAAGRRAHIVIAIVIVGLGGVVVHLRCSGGRR
jgi:hypothetical protein